MTSKKKRQNIKDSPYQRFSEVNGDHPLKKQVPDSFVEYKARTRKGGKVALFNFDLAREIGLISEDHPDELNKHLEKRILETFGIIIINEFDEMNNREFPENEIRDHKYMATRYLQLQHDDKLGKSSGDGRSLWNGTLRHKGKTYDISSCGTGATKLSPATTKYNKFFESGDPTISYGCGYSERDEGLETLFMSEIFHHNNIPTERCLAIIEFEKGYSVNVRVHDNLLRPSHLFLYLKQNDHENLKKLLDYYLKRQLKNKVFKNHKVGDKALYEEFLYWFCNKFSTLVADLEDHYIFCWLDWDGDNILMDGSLLDYGSIRQFGLYHHEYRYDDMDRYSTSISEQKNKGRYLVQTMAQLVDFVVTGSKPALKDYSEHKVLKAFEKNYEQRKNQNLLFQIGFEKVDIDSFLSKNRTLVESFRKTFSYFECAKSVEGPYEVPDGVNWNAIFCMRDILRELPQLYLSREEMISHVEFIEILRSSYATDKDVELTSYRKNKIKQFQADYMKLMKNYTKFKGENLSAVLMEVSLRSAVINKYDRITGDSITKIVETLSQGHAKKKLNPLTVYSFLKELVVYQNLNPDRLGDSPKKGPSFLLKSALNIVKDYRESV
ncbi:MAG: protein adenylyltransferase SelO family protein [Bacteriovoracaceae bacterium]